MMLAKVLRAIRRVFGFGGERELDELHPPSTTHRILERERARCDRSGDTLAVIAFAPPPKEGRARLAPLVGVLQARVRTTDAVGWLDQHRVCAVLPGTGMEGARKVAEDVFEALPEDEPLPECTVFIYPSGPPQGEEQAPRPAEQATVLAAKPAALDALLLRPTPLWKRAIDITGALVGLALLAPVFVVIAVAIKLSSPGPIIFRQRRGGRGGWPFWMYKFRTMVADAEARKEALLAHNEQDGPAFKIRNDPRVTRLGRFLRKTSLDELPQLWNVLKGDMSLVGPRPLPCAEADACEGWQRRRLDVTPGITCIWQVRGRSAVSFADWVRMDVQYIRSQSLPQDLKLLLLTVPAVLLRRGAH